MSASRYPPPPIPPIDGRRLGKPPRSMFIACAVHDFGMSEAEAAAMVDEQLTRLGVEDEVDLSR